MSFTGVFRVRADVLPGIGGDTLSDRASKRTIKLQLMLGPEELVYIDDWRFENRLPSRAAAIRELIRRGLHIKVDDSETGSKSSSRDFGVID